MVKKQVFRSINEFMKAYLPKAFEKQQRMKTEKAQRQRGRKLIEW